MTYDFWYLRVFGYFFLRQYEDVACVPYIAPFCVLLAHVTVGLNGGGGLVVCVLVSSCRLKRGEWIRDICSF